MSSNWNLQAALSKEEGNAFRKNSKLFHKYATSAKSYDLGKDWREREFVKNIKTFEVRLDFYDSKLKGKMSLAERRLSEAKQRRERIELIKSFQTTLITKNNQQQMRGKIEDYFSNLKIWDESFDPKVEIEEPPPPPPRKRKTGFRRRMKHTGHMVRLMAGLFISWFGSFIYKYIRRGRSKNRLPKS